MKRTIKDYEDIIDLPRPQSKHPKMDMQRRAAQFTAFMPLDGYKEILENGIIQQEKEVENEIERIKYYD